MKKRKSKIDIATILGLMLALGGIIGGLVLEGGHIEDIAQITAFVIVVGGTMGAVLLTTPMAVLRGAGRRLRRVFWEDASPLAATIDSLVDCATRARKQGLISLESDLDHMDDPFFKKALSLAVDGLDLQELRKMMELEIVLEERRGEAEAKVFEAAGGYSPTIGIIGAVLGLIQVMKHLENIEAVGHGIAVAFVATVYGVGLANLFFLPAAQKIKARLHEDLLHREMVIEGVLSISEGLNPKLIRSKLEAFAREHTEPNPPKKAPARTVSRAASVEG